MKKFIVLFSVLLLLPIELPATMVNFNQTTPGEFIDATWKHYNENNRELLKLYAEGCIRKYGDKAERQQEKLSQYDYNKQASLKCEELTAVATCTYILAIYYKNNYWSEEANRLFSILVRKFTHATIVFQDNSTKCASECAFDDSVKTIPRSLDD